MTTEPRYRVQKLYDENGQVAAHFLDPEFYSFSPSWDQAMADPRFARIIDRDVAAEQRADESLEHLAAYAPNDRVRTRFLHWLHFIDDQLTPWTTGGAIHFRPHWARVLMLALTMGDAAGLSDTDLDALAAAAVFHDSRRKNPYLDTGHGDRAAHYYADFCAQQTENSALAAPDGPGEATAEAETPASPHAQDATSALRRFDPRTYLAMQWHDRDDDQGLRVIASALERDELPTSSTSREKRTPLQHTADAFHGMDHGALLLPNGLSAALPEGADADAATLYRMFKDADGLDRIRLGEGGLDPHFLRFQYAHDALPLAHQLLAASE